MMRAGLGSIAWRLWPAALTAGAAAAFFLAIVFGARLIGRPVLPLLTDMAAVADLSPFTSILSNLGVFMMAATAAVCVFAASLARSDRGLLLAAGLFTTMVFADDFLLLHSNLAPKVLGLPGVIVYAAYGAVAAAVAWRFRARLTGLADLPLALAIGLLAVSVAIDLAGPATRRAMVAEEGAKFVGYAVWSVYWMTRAHATLRRATAGATRPA